MSDSHKASLYWLLQLHLFEYIFVKTIFLNASITAPILILITNASFKTELKLLKDMVLPRILHFHSSILSWLNHFGA